MVSEMSLNVRFGDYGLGYGDRVRGGIASGDDARPLPFAVAVGEIRRGVVGRVRASRGEFAAVVGLPDLGGF